MLQHSSTRAPETRGFLLMPHFRMRTTLWVRRLSRAGLEGNPVASRIARQCFPPAIHRSRAPIHRGRSRRCGEGDAVKADPQPRIAGHTGAWLDARDRARQGHRGAVNGELATVRKALRSGPGESACPTPSSTPRGCRPIRGCAPCVPWSSIALSVARAALRNGREYPGRATAPATKTWHPLKSRRDANHQSEEEAPCAQFVCLSRVMGCSALVVPC